MWEFDRITRGPMKGGYTHHLFLRSQPGLCDGMVRQTKSVVREYGSASSDGSSCSTTPDIRYRQSCSSNWALPRPRTLAEYLDLFQKQEDQTPTPPIIDNNLWDISCCDDEDSSLFDCADRYMIASGSLIDPILYDLDTIFS